MKVWMVFSAAAAVFFVMLATLTLLLQDRIALQKRMYSVKRQMQPDSAYFPQKTPKHSLIQKLFAGKNQHLLEHLGDELYIAGIALRPEEFMAMWVIAGFVVPLAARILEVNFIVVLGLIIVGCALPVVYVKAAKARCVKVFDAQLLDALTIMCNSLRAGFSFQTAMENIANEMQDPIAREFRRVVRECHLGMSLEESLARLVQRSGNEDLDLIVSAVLIQKQVGGNLAEVLENISGTIQQRIKLRGDIKVMTSSGMMSGYIIGLLPVIMLVALMLLTPEYIEDFLASDIGRILLVLATFMEAIGFYFVRKIVNVKF